MKNAKTKTALPLSRKKRIAIVATAAVLLCALVFGIVWTSVDHSYRYDRADLTQFFKNGTVGIDFDSLTSLPLEIETELTEDKITTTIGSNLLSIKDYKKKVASGAKIHGEGTKLPYHDTLFLYYSVTAPGKNEGDPDTTLLANTKFYDEESATTVQLGSGKLNSMIEEWILKNPDITTAIDRRVDKNPIQPGHTLVLDITGSYTKDDATKTYFAMTDFFYQPDTTPADTSKTYYEGQKITADTLKADSSVKKIDARVVARLAQEIAALDEIGDVAEFTMDASIDTDTQTVHPATFKVTLKSTFLAETVTVEFDLDTEDEEDFAYGKTFTYMESGSEKKIDSGKLEVMLSVESVLTLNKETVGKLTESATGFTAPTEFGEGEEAEDAAYASAYLVFQRKKLLDEARDAIIAKEEEFAAKVKTALWEKIVKTYSTEDVIASLPEKEFENGCRAMLEYHKANYAANYSTQYASAYEYMLKAVYDDADAAKLTATEQEKKVKSHIEKEVREAICEKILLFTFAEHYGITVTGKEIREYKQEYRDAIYTSLLAQYKIYYSSMSEGELMLLARDEAKANVNAYTKTYYRECVALREVQNTLVTDPAAFAVTWTLAGQASSD